MSDLRVSERTAKRRHCEACDAPFEHITGFLHEGSAPYAAYFAACHRHPAAEVQFDVVLGTWGTDDASDHVTFSCRVRDTGAMVVDATVATDSADPILGLRLRRDEALEHPWLERLWEITDFLAAEDATIAFHLRG